MILLFSILGGSWLKSLSSFNFMDILDRSSNLWVTESTSKKAEKEDDCDSEEKNLLVPNENYPHFEPIAQLPNLVETKTDEDELIGDSSFIVSKLQIFCVI